MRCDEVLCSGVRRMCGCSAAAAAAAAHTKGTVRQTEGGTAAPKLLELSNAQSKAHTNITTHAILQLEAMQTSLVVCFSEHESRFVS